MASPFLGEFMGTLVLILLGNGVVANVLPKRSKAEGSGWMVITSGWAFAVMAGVFTATAFAFFVLLITGYSDAQTVRCTTWNLQWFPNGSANETSTAQQDQRIKEAAGFQTN